MSADQRALEFLRFLRRTPALGRGVADADPTMEDLLALAAAHGFDIDEASLGRAFRADWLMRRLHYGDRSRGGDNAASPPPATDGSRSR